MPQLPALQLEPRNALLDLTPVNNALMGIQRQQNENRNYEMEQQRLGMEQQRFAQQSKSANLDYETKLATRSAGLAQMAKAEKNPQRKAAMMERMYSLAPNYRDNLIANGINPDDHDGVADFVIAQARGYQDPMDVEAKRLEMDYKRAQIAKMNSPSAAGGTYKEVGGNLVRVMPDGTVQEVYKGKPSFTPGETAVDKAYAKTYESDIVSGGLADADKNLAAIKSVQSALTDKKGPNLTGPIIGRLPDAVTSFTNPEAINMRDRVEEVVQRNLRVILGAQFTNEEGKRLIARAYNPALSEEQNAQRLGALASAMEQALQAKKAAAAYFEQNGSLKGFKGKTDFSFSDFENAIESPAGSVSGTASAPSGAPSTTMASPKSAEDYAALPSGTRYTAPDGSVRIKP